MNEVKVPDYEWGPWSPEYTKDFYYDPETGKIVYSKITINITRKELALREQLLPFWMGKATRFRHDDPKANAECVAIRPMNEEPAVMMWGLRGASDDDSARAVKVNGFWRLLKPTDVWEFGDWVLSADGKKLNGFSLYLNDRKIAKY